MIRAKERDYGINISIDVKTTNTVDHVKGEDLHVGSAVTEFGPGLYPAAQAQYHSGSTCKPTRELDLGVVILI